MNNQQAMSFFKGLTHKAQNNPNVVKLAHNTDYTNLDAQFILKYSRSDSKILDIASGTGLIINKIYDKVGYIECIEPYPDFSKFIVKSDNVKVVNKNIFQYTTNQHFDLITLFGFMHYVNEEEARQIYKKCYDFLTPDGTIIVKNQFGITQDVNISGYSQENKADYYAQYRFIGKEKSILTELGFGDVEHFDIYPPKANRFDNTKFFAVVGKMKIR